MGDLYSRFYVTFIYEERYLLFLEGFGMTLLLTLSSFLLGSVLGAFFCVLKLSKIEWVKKATDAFLNILVQLPTMVLLLLFVYIIFGESVFSVAVIVIFGLALKASAYIAEIFYTAITSVNKGEVEAASTLGLSKFQTFRYIMLPQAIKTALPIYKNQFVITLQETAVVGYLAIVDLTRASDIVTSRTLDAMFGLVTISIIYLLMGWVGTRLLDLLGIEKHIGGEKA